MRVVVTELTNGDQPASTAIENAVQPVSTVRSTSRSRGSPPRQRMTSPLLPKRPTPQPSMPTRRVPGQASSITGPAGMLRPACPGSSTAPRTGPPVPITSLPSLSTVRRRNCTPRSGPIREASPSASMTARPRQWTTQPSATRAADWRGRARYSALASMSLPSALSAEPGMAVRW